MHIAKRKIKGRVYFFIEKSLRLPDRRIRKLSKFIGRIKPEKIEKEKLKKYFYEKEKVLFSKWAVKNLQFNYPLTAEEIKKIEETKVEYNYLKRNIPKENMKDLLDRFTVNFAYESNALEGNSLTLKDVAIVIFEKEGIPGKSLREIYETRNHWEVIEKLFEKKIKIRHKPIIQMHKLLMKDIEKRSGYKKFPNIILGSPVKTSPPEEVFEDMSKLIKWYDKNKPTMHPLQLSCLFHGKFLKIHPFADGNGRVARVLSNAILVNNGYPPLIIRKTTRVRYLNSLRAFDQGSVIKLTRFFLEGYKKTFNKFFKIYSRYI